MADIIRLLDEPETSVAVVGATDDPAKYGYTIYRDLKRKGYRVFPVNRNRPEVDGDQAYRSVAEIPRPPTIVNIVVPPHEAVAVLRECSDHGLKNVWLQPGAEDPRVMRFLRDNGFNYLANACIMVQSRFKK